MSLQELDLKGYGHFESKKASFTLDTLNLPTGWEYIYQNRRLLLKVDQHGPVYAQVDPPSDIVLFRRDAFQRHASWLVWLSSPSFRQGSFTNFFRPLQSTLNPAALPERYSATFSPSQALYTIEHEGVRCQTRIFIPAGQATIVSHVSVTNLGAQPIAVCAMPVLRPFFNTAMMAAWDKPEWYVRSALVHDGQPGFSLQLLNSGSDASRRRAAVLWSDKADLSRAEISYEKFAGQGTFDNPEAIARRELRLPLDAARPWGVCDPQNTLIGYPQVHALQYDLKLKPGETRVIRQVLAMLPSGADGFLPDRSVAHQAAVWLDDSTCQREVQAIQDEYERLFNVRTVRTPDTSLNQYVNEWLPLQLDWVCSLDRGWPSGMRGSRDSGNDFTAMVPLNPAWAREIITTLFSCQRQDGWIPRQYSALGRHGTHDLRQYMDAGNWALELLHTYLCFSRDFELLSTPLPWLDSDTQATLLEHALSALDFFIRPENLGGHGLCKIGQGDWLDAANKAGLQGRGESVTITNQTLISLSQLAELMANLQAARNSKLLPAAEIERLLRHYQQAHEALRRNLRTHAYNREGYFNSIFNDEGVWLFSDKDPDGQRRVYGPANWWSLSSGAALPDLAQGVLKELDGLKCPAGYRLCWPPMGFTPISGVGRIGSGDLVPGRSENATAYNQGSHGFLARGLAAAGEGDRLYEVLQYLLPYDQSKHPVASAITPPYAVVNCWQNLPGFPERGGMLFLTGSIAYGLRAVYEWMYGIKPRLDGLAIDPCIPSAFKQLSAEFNWRSARVRLTISNPSKSQCGVRSMSVDGTPVDATVLDPFSRRRIFVAPDRLFDSRAHELVVTL